MITQRQDYFTYATENMLIDMDDRGTFAKVPSEVNHKRHYRVDIDESVKVPVATNCQCGDRQYRHTYCKHMQIIDLFYQHIAGIFHFEETTPVEQVMEQAHNEMVKFYNSCTDYEVLATTKHCASSVVYGTCGHLAKHANEPCGSCLDRMMYGY